MIHAKALPDPARRPLTALARLLFLTAALSLFAAGAQAQAGLGDPAPDFTLTGNDGASYTLSEAFGQQVQLIYFIGYS